MTFRCVLLMVATALAALTAPAAAQKSIKDKALSDITDMKNLLEKIRLQIEKDSKAATANTTTAVAWTEFDTTDSNGILLNASTPSNEAEPNTTSTPSNVTEPDSSSSPQVTVALLPNGPGNEAATTSQPNATEPETTATSLPNVTETQETTAPLFDVTGAETTATSSLLSVSENDTMATPLQNETETNTTSTPLSAIVPNTAISARTTTELEASTTTTEAKTTRRQTPPPHYTVPSSLRSINLYAKLDSHCSCGNDADKQFTAGQLLIVPNETYDTGDDITTKSSFQS